MTRLVRACVAIALLTAAPRSVRAQAGTHFNIAAGPTAVTGSFGDRVDIGYHILAGVSMTQPGLPIAFRLEGIYNEFNEKNSSNQARATGVMTGAVYEVSHSQGFTLYGIGGFGYYHTAEAVTVFTPGGLSSLDVTDNNIGYNIGGGARFPIGTFSAYFEIRYHAVTNTDFHFVPITFGLLF